MNLMEGDKQHARHRLLIYFSIKMIYWHVGIDVTG